MATEYNNLKKFWILKKNLGYKYELGFIILCLVLIVSMVIGLYSFYKASALIPYKLYGISYTT